MTAKVETTAQASPQRSASFDLVDCDIHHMVPSQEALMKYLPARWQNYHLRFGPRRLLEPEYWVTTPNVLASRVDAFPPSGLPPGSDLDFLRTQLLDEWDIKYGLLNGAELFMFGTQPGDYGAALIRASNEFTADEWLDPEPRLRSAISVTVDNVPAAVDEIRHWAGDPRFVQVMITMRNEAPMGDRRYWPIYRAAVEAGLPVAVHVGGINGHPPTGTGWFSYYFEMHAGHVQPFQAHTASLALSGVFDEIPDLKIVFAEGGFSWTGPLAWRLDRLSRTLREEVPNLQRLPSEYMREHFWFTTQPIEEPDVESQFHTMVDALGLEDRLMFATDYPHWDFDAPTRALPRRLSDDAKRKIFSGNALALYRLPAIR